MNAKTACLCSAVMAVVAGAVAKPAFYLPERLYAAPGLELNVYYKNVFDSVVPQNYAFQAYAKKGRSELTRWCWTPTEADAGTTVEVVVNAWSDEGLVAAVTTTVEVAVAPADPKRKMTFALLGDSLTNCRFQDRILADMRAAGFENFTPIGTRRGEGPDSAAHDGFGGYTCGTFLRHYSISDEEFAHIQDAAEREQLLSLGVPTKIVHAYQRALLRSPLVSFKNGKKQLDIPGWLGRINGGEPPDVLLIELGVNNIFSYLGEAEDLRARIRRDVIPSYDELLDALRPFMPKTRFALVTQANGCSQDGFAVNYGANWNEVQHRKNMFALNRELEAFARRRGVELVPMGNCVDPFHGYIRKKVPASAVSKDIVERDANAVHQSEIGGYQIGDSIAAWLRCSWNRK